MRKINIKKTIMVVAAVAFVAALFIYAGSFDSELLAAGYLY